MGHNLRWKRLSAVALSGIALASLTACGTGAPAQTGGSAASGGAQSPAPAAKKADPVTLTFVVPNTTTTQPYVDIFKKYEEKTGNKVEIQALPSGEDYGRLLLTRFSTKDYPDLFYMDPGTKQYVKFRADEELYDFTNEDFTQRMTDSIKQFQTLNGKIYGIPWGSSGGLGFYYNKDAFKKAGVDVPSNYADLLTVLGKLKAAGITPMYEAVKDAWPVQIFSLAGWSTFVDPAIGKDGVDKLERNELKLADIPQLKQLFQRQYELKSKGYYQNSPLAGTYDEQQDLLGKGQVGVVLQLESMLPSLAKKFGEDFVRTKIGFFPMPSDTDKGVATITPPNQLLVPKNGKKAKAAVDLIRFMTTKEALDIWYKANPGVPVYKEATSQLYPAQEDVVKYTQEGKAQVNIKNRLTASMVDYDKILQNMFINGNVDEALKQVDDKYRKDGANKKLPGF
ncbi:ABC transporter substrate-binding protein [Paenibacillus hamazuiensis]|uniref:ABC transporter substrate-binding protein n=1 Tax=Paenibacillus hamazuiensis TaxID=2936508 RepID=UPI00200F41F9|nr:extracellular solute-binding protein [Paenibacillus hamazuiensis]